MAIKIGELLVSRGLITREQLENALLGQKQFGGRLGTNLVEMGLVSEDQVVACLSEQLGLPWARPQALAAIPDHVIAKVPVHLAEKYRVVPLRLDRELHIAMADPQNFDRIDEITFALGLRLRPYVVTEVSLNYALERYYGIRREIRHLTAVQFGLRGTPVFGVPVVGSSGISQLSSFSAESPSVSVFDDLANVMTEEDVARAVVRYFADIFPFLALCKLGEGHAVPTHIACNARPMPAPAPSPLSIHPPSWLGAVLAKPQIFYRQQVSDGELVRLLAQMGAPAEHLTLIPLMDGTRVVHVLAGQGREESYLRGVISGMRTFLAKTSHALRIVALRNDIRTT